MKTPRTVLFDLDGTLLDTLEDLRTGVNAAMRAMGLPCRSAAQVRRALGNGAAALLRDSLQDRTDRLEEALALFNAAYPPATDPKTAPYPGIPALLAELRAEGWRIAILSNKPDRAVALLRDEFFPEVALAVGEREGVRRKPWPDGVRAAMTALSADPARTVYVGDSEVDLATGQNAGLPVILVTWGFRDREQLEEAGGTAFADDPAALHRLLDGLFEA